MCSHVLCSVPGVLEQVAKLAQQIQQGVLSEGIGDGRVERQRWDLLHGMSSWTQRRVTQVGPRSTLLNNRTTCFCRRRSSPGSQSLQRQLYALICLNHALIMP